MMRDEVCVGKPAAFLTLILLMAWASGSARAQDGNTEARIVVGPEVLVSRDGDLPHVELHLAANPKDRRNLVGGAITMTRPEGGFATKTYASLDGGHSWQDATFPEQVQWGGADPQLAFTPHGTAIFVTLAMGKDEDGRSRGFMHAYRSEDGGLTWSDAVDLRYSWDHPQIAVDQTPGRYGGRVYVGVLYGYPVYRVGVFRSEDDGRSWIGPAEAANGGGVLGINVMNLGVFSDGTLFVPYIDFEFDPEKIRQLTRYESTAWFVTSSDGGVTFSEPGKILTQTMPKEADRRFLAFGRQWAVDGGAGSPYRDRVYMVWAEVEGERARLLTSYSTDRGKTWSAARPLDPGLPDDGSQYMPAIAVSDSGVVAITWSDTRHSADGKSYRQYFTASIDGGESWLVPVALSTQDADPYGAGNVRFRANAWRYPQDSLRISMTSAASRWPAGGDYIGLAADRRGVFHPFWPDARTGTFQIMTAAVAIEGGAESSAEAAGTAELVERTVTNWIDVVMDPTRYDSETKTAVLPIRLRNSGTTPIHVPLRLIIRGFGSGQGAELQEFSPEVLGASNGRTGDGAELDFTPQLGSSGVLAPGATTGALELRLRVKDPLQVPDLHVEVRGRVASVPP